MGRSLLSKRELVITASLFVSICIVAALLGRPAREHANSKETRVAAPPPKATSPAWSMHSPIPVSAAQYGEKWPFTVQSGFIAYEAPWRIVFVAEDGTKYGLNGVAKMAGYRDVETIWRVDPEYGPPVHVPYQWMIELAIDRWKLRASDDLPPGQETAERESREPRLTDRHIPLPVSASEWGERWPFTVDDGYLQYISPGQIVFINEALPETFALNEAARSAGYDDVRKILRIRTTNGVATRMSVQPLVRYAIDNWGLETGRCKVCPKGAHPEADQRS